MDERMRQSVIAKLHNQHKGERLFIMGVGPSLNDIPKDLLVRVARNEAIFGCNFLMRWGKIPHSAPLYWAVAESDVITHVHESLLLRGMRPLKFYSNQLQLNAPPDWVYIRSGDAGSVEDMQQGYVSGLGDVLEPVGGNSGSVIGLMIQLGLWMGFDPIYLLGCDASVEGHAYEDVLIVPRKRQDSFQRSALAAYQAMKKAGRTLIDLTEGGTLPVPKGRLGDVLK